MDKWLWAARFFKTRELASKACELGRVTVGGARVKPAKEVRVGDVLSIRKEDGEYEVEVLELSQQRGPAPVAQTLYRESEASVEARRRAAEERRLSGVGQLPPLSPGRPTKRDRRLIHSFTGRR